MADPTPALKTALDQFSADVAELRAAAEKIAGGAGGARGPRARRPANALLKFHEAFLVFGAALLSALFIGFPAAKDIVPKIGGLDGAQLYSRTLVNLVWMISISGVVAFLLQLFQNKINEKGMSPGNGLLCLFALLTAVALGFGLHAAWPFLTAI